MSVTCEERYELVGDIQDDDQVVIVDYVQSRVKGEPCRHHLDKTGGERRRTSMKLTWKIVILLLMHHNRNIFKSAQYKTNTFHLLKRFLEDILVYIFSERHLHLIENQNYDLRVWCSMKNHFKLKKPLVGTH